MKSEFLGTLEFCSTCHGVVHPLNGFIVERTYDEWKTSIYAQKGIQCRDCHMQPVEKAIETATTLVKAKNPGRLTPVTPTRDHVYSHHRQLATMARYDARRQTDRHRGNRP